MVDKLKIGVIGTGRIGKLHVEHIMTRIPDAGIIAVADPNVDAAQEVADTYEIAHVYEDHHDLLKRDDVQAVIISSASKTHPQMIIDSAAAGKHIFCEKPIGFELDEIDAALEAVEKAGVKLQIGFNRRFDRNFSHVKKRITAGDIGTPHVLKITSRDPEPPPPDYLAGWGGVFKETTIHDFDMVRFIMGSEVKRVFCVGGVRDYPSFKDTNDLDTTVMMLEFENGAFGTIDNSYNAVYGYDQRLEVFGSNGMLRVENERPNMTEHSNDDGIHLAKPLYFFLDRYIDSFVVEMRDFVKCVREDKEPSVTGFDGRAPVVLAIACRKSYDERRPVDISEIG